MLRESITEDVKLFIIIFIFIWDVMIVFSLSFFGIIYVLLI